LAPLDESDGGEKKTLTRFSKFPIIDQVSRLLAWPASQGTLGLPCWQGPSAATGDFHEDQSMIVRPFPFVAAACCSR
jgi:hypothetical protein